MVALRSRRLESVLGASFDALTAASVRALVDLGVQEAFDLDFKSSLYGRSDSEKRALGGDVAALANTAGGVIVIGVEEDQQARAVGAPGVEVTDGEVGRIRQVVASAVCPLPVFDVITLLDEQTAAVTGPPQGEAAGQHAEDDVPALALPSAHGFIIIAVPRSARAPHAVLVNDALRYPRRNGATTYYLSEPEVAAAYRDRLSAAGEQSRRITTIEREAQQRLAVIDAWVMVSLVPDLPGDLVITRQVHRVFLQQVVGVEATPLPSGVSFQRAQVSRRRLLADATSNSSPLAEDVSLELHADGAGVFALAIPNLDARQRDEPSSTEGEVVPQLVDDESVVLGVLAGLLHLARHARDRAAAGGEAVVRAQMVPVSAARPMQIGHTRSYGTVRSQGYQRTEPAEPAEAVAALDDLAEPGPALIAVVSALVNELGQAFGMPEMAQVTRDGRIRRRHWSHNGWQQQLASWAQEHAIEVTDTTLP